MSKHKEIAKISSSVTEHDFRNFQLCIVYEESRKGSSLSIVVEAVEVIKKIHKLQHVNVRLSPDKIFIWGQLPISYEKEKLLEDLKKYFPNCQYKFIETNYPPSWKIYLLIGNKEGKQQTFKVILRTTIETIFQTGDFLAVNADGNRLVIKDIESDNDQTVVFTITTEPVGTDTKALLRDCNEQYVHAEVEKDIYRIHLLPEIPDEWFQYKEEKDFITLKFQEKWLGVKLGAVMMVDQIFKFHQVPAKT